MKNLMLLLLIISLVSCATANKINNISIGMTKPQVIAVMGDPNSTSATANQEVLLYELYSNSDDIFNGSPTDYFIRLIDGAVEAYGRLGDFDSTQDPAQTIRLEIE